MTIVYFILYFLGHMLITLAYMSISHSEMCNKLFKMMYYDTLPKPPIPEPRYEIKPELDGRGETVYSIIDTKNSDVAVFKTKGILSAKSKLVEMNNL